MKAEDIKKLRNKLGLSQEKFARLLNVSYMSVNRWEADKTKPSGLALLRLQEIANGNIRITNS